MCVFVSPFLYAETWNEEIQITYFYGNSLSFHGHDTLDTKLPLFWNDLLNRNFEISFWIDNVMWCSACAQKNRNNLFSVMQESANPYQWLHLYKEKDKSDYYLQVTSNKNSPSNYTIKQISGTDHSMKISRINNSVFYNGEHVLQLNDFAGSFEVPLTFGSSLDWTQKPWRYLSWVLTDVQVMVEYPDRSQILLPSPTRTNYSFKWWYDEDGNKITSINEIHTDMKLYALWGSAEESMKDYTVEFYQQQNDGTYLKSYEFTRTALIGSSVSVISKDVTPLEGWIYDADFADNILTWVLSEDEDLVLKVYFKQSSSWFQFVWKHYWRVDQW